MAIEPNYDLPVAVARDIPQKDIPIQLSRIEMLAAVLDDKLSMVIGRLTPVIQNQKPNTNGQSESPQRSGSEYSQALATYGDRLQDLANRLDWLYEVIDL